MDKKTSPVRLESIHHLELHDEEPAVEPLPDCDEDDDGGQEGEGEGVGRQGHDLKGRDGGGVDGGTERNWLIVVQWMHQVLFYYPSWLSMPRHSMVAASLLWSTLPEVELSARKREASL